MTTTIPQPRFAIGDKVFVVSTDTTLKRLPCPDCADTREWTATSATGEVFRIQCPRCVSGMWGRDIPSLERRVATFSIRELTVGSIKMDTAKRDGSMFRYMCVETGVGTGSVYPESGSSYCTHATREEAEAFAERLRMASQAKLDADPASIRAEAYALMPLRSAFPYEWREQVYHAWDTARDWHKAAQEIIRDEHGEFSSVAEIHDKLRDVMVPRPWRNPHPVDALIAAAHAALPVIASEELRAVLASALAGVSPPLDKAIAHDEAREVTK